MDGPRETFRVNPAHQLRHPVLGCALRNNPDALLFVTQGGTTNPRAVGVRYDGALGRWTIFNENNTAMPANAKFNVRVATPGDASFVHNTNAFNVLFNWTYLDHPLLNNQPDAQFFITHNANPSNGAVGPSVTSPLAASWDAASGKWTVVTQDLGGMPWGASFNILVRP